MGIRNPLSSMLPYTVYKVLSKDLGAAPQKKRKTSWKTSTNPNVISNW